MKLLFSLFITLLLVACIPSKVSYFHPHSEIGEVGINGCSQIPNTVRYENGSSTYSVELFEYGLIYELVVKEGDSVEWRNNTFSISSAKDNLKFQAHNLANPHTRDYCNVMFLCESYDRYSEVINFSTDQINFIKIMPANPIINGKVLEVDEIEYSYDESVLLQAINC
jgi:hypothetical protein